MFHHRRKPLNLLTEKTRSNKRTREKVLVQNSSLNAENLLKRIENRIEFFQTHNDLPY